MIKAVVFDLDDTLILEKDYINSGFEVVAGKISVAYNIEKNIVLSKLKSLFQQGSKNVFNRLLDDMHIKYSEQFIRRLVYEYRNHEPNIQLLEEAKEIISYLKDNGYKIGIITDGYKETQRNKLKALKLSFIFNEIIITDELGREFWKPHELAYRKMKENLGCDFPEIAYIGDNERNDFITAKKLGMKTFKIFREAGIYKNNLYSEEFKADKEINNLIEVIGYL